MTKNVVLKAAFAGILSKHRDAIATASTLIVNSAAGADDQVMITWVPYNALDTKTDMLVPCGGLLAIADVGAEQVREGDDLIASIQAKFDEMVDNFDGGADLPWLLTWLEHSTDGDETHEVLLLDATRLPAMAD